MLLFVSDSFQPEIFAHIEIGRVFIEITNGNDSSWNQTTVTLNDAWGGPTLEITDPWKPGEVRRLRLREFRGRLNRQVFNPDFESVREVIIKADGFRIGIYKVKDE